MISNDTKQVESPSRDAPSLATHGASSLPVLMLLFAGSGCAALIYEIVWFQMLQLVIGSTAISMGVLLATFMAGMCLGSLALPRFSPGGVHPIRVWALLELGIGLLGVATVALLPALTNLYIVSAPGGVISILFRALLCGACLLPPTLLMGATLPAISRAMEASPAGMSRVGLLYGANTLGAVFGALLAGFYLLRVFDTITAVGVAAAINGALALLGWNLPRWVFQRAILEEPDLSTTSDSGPRWPVFVTIGLSGFCALGAEVVWTRLLSLMLGGTTYTFSIILAVFLTGLALGSGVGAVLGRQKFPPRFALGLCQILSCGAIAWAALMLAKSLPYWPISPTLSKSIWFNFQLDLVRCLWAILPATCLWGASFPLALTAVAGGGQDYSRLVGRLYAANTVGAILGAIASSLLLVGWLGTQQTQRLFIGISAAAGALVILAPAAFEPRQGTTPNAAFRPNRIVVKAVGVSWVGLVVAVLVWTVPPLPWPLVAYGRYLPGKSELGTALYVGEGMNASVAVTELDTGVRNFHVSGKIEASSDQRDMRLQRMLGHIPALFHPDPHSVLVVGCGAGVTAGSFLVHPGIQKVTLCEIEPLIPNVVARYFGEENYDVVEDPRVRLIYDDARHFVLTTREQFDIITSDPIHPWVKGAATLYTREYFELCKRHLKPGGMVTQWVPLYESNLATVKSEIATFFDVFPDGTIWSNDDMGEGYDLVLLGQVGPLEVDVDALQQRLGRADHQAVTLSLRDVGIRSAFSLVATFAGQAHDLRPWLPRAIINRDRDLRLQYLAGMALNFNESDLIYSDLSSYRRFPDEIFIGSNVWNDALRRSLEPPKVREKDLQKPARGSRGTDGPKR